MGCSKRHNTVWWDSSLQQRLFLKRSNYWELSPAVFPATVERSPAFLEGYSLAYEHDSIHARGTFFFLFLPCVLSPSLWQPQSQWFFTSPHGEWSHTVRHGYPISGFFFFPCFSWFPWTALARASIFPNSASYHLWFKIEKYQCASMEKSHLLGFLDWGAANHSPSMRNRQVQDWFLLIFLICLLALKWMVVAFLFLAWKEC